LLARISADSLTRPGRFFIALVSKSALAYMPLSANFKPWQWVVFGPFAFQPSFAPQYAIYFFAGLAIGSHGLERGLLAPDGLLAQHWKLWVVVAPAAFLLWIIPTALIVNEQDAIVPGLQLVADLGFVLSSATICFAVTAVFLRFAATPRPMLASLSEHAYGIYLVHYFFVIWLQYLLLGAALFAVAKAAVVFTGTLLMSWAATAAACRVSIGARLMGGRRRESATAP
jgi:glucan biosynthesis protein C